MSLHSSKNVLTEKTKPIEPIRGCQASVLGGYARNLDAQEFTRGRLMTGDELSVVTG